MPQAPLCLPSCMFLSPFVLFERLAAGADILFLPRVMTHPLCFNLLLSLPVTLLCFAPVPCFLSFLSLFYFVPIPCFPRFYSSSLISLWSYPVPLSAISSVYTRHYRCQMQPFFDLLAVQNVAFRPLLIFFHLPFKAHQEPV